MDTLNFLSSAEAENNGGQFTTNINSGSFAFVADESEVLGGKNLGPAPGDYLCMALASCKAMTLRMYVRRKQWNVDTIKVKVGLVKGDQLPSGINTFYSDIRIAGNFDEEQRKRMLYIAKACPISRLLQKESEVITSLEMDDISLNKPD